VHAAASLLLAAAAALAQASPPAGGLDAAIRLFEAHRYAEARAALETLVVERPGDATAALYLGRTCFEQEMPEAAARSLERAAALDPSSSTVQYWLGRAYGEQAIAGNLLVRAKLAGRVRHAFERAVELDPSNVDARMALFEFHLRAPSFMGGSVEKAVVEAEEIRRLDPFRGRRAAGRLHENRKRYDLAALEYEAALHEPPPRPNPYFWMEDAAIERKDWPAAFAAMDRLERAFPEDAEALYEIGRLAAISGRELDRGEAALHGFLDRDPPPPKPSFAMAHWRLGQILERRGDRGSAKREYEAAIRLDPLLTEARLGLARLR
jgi:tetratricopeptide (TPR) repeat protein